MFQAKQLHEMLVLARKQLNLDVIQGYLQGRHSVFKDMPGQLVVFSTIVSPGCVRLDSSKGTEKRPLPKSQ